MRVHCLTVTSAWFKPGTWMVPTFVPGVRKLFYVPEEPKTPSWIQGVLVILVANWQIISQ